MRLTVHVASHPALPWALSLGSLSHVCLSLPHQNPSFQESTAAGSRSRLNCSNNHDQQLELQARSEHFLVVSLNPHKDLMRPVLSQCYRKGNHSREKVNILPKVTHAAGRNWTWIQAVRLQSLPNTGSPPSLHNEAFTSHWSGTERSLPYHKCLATTLFP